MIFHRIVAERQTLCTADDVRIRHRDVVRLHAIVKRKHHIRCGIHLCRNRTRHFRSGRIVPKITSVAEHNEAADTPIHRDYVVIDKVDCGKRSNALPHFLGQIVLCTRFRCRCQIHIAVVAVNEYVVNAIRFRRCYVYVEMIVSRTIVYNKRHRFFACNNLCTIHDLGDTIGPRNNFKSDLIIAEVRHTNFAVTRRTKRTDPPIFFKADNRPTKAVPRVLDRFAFGISSLRQGKRPRFHFFLRTDFVIEFPFVFHSVHVRSACHCIRNFLPNGNKRRFTRHRVRANVHRFAIQRPARKRLAGLAQPRCIDGRAVFVFYRFTVKGDGVFVLRCRNNPRVSSFAAHRRDFRIPCARVREFRRVCRKSGRCGCYGHRAVFQRFFLDYRAIFLDEFHGICILRLRHHPRVGRFAAHRCDFRIPCTCIAKFCRIFRKSRRRRYGHRAICHHFFFEHRTCFINEFYQIGVCRFRHHPRVGRFAAHRRDFRIPCARVREFCRVFRKSRRFGCYGHRAVFQRFLLHHRAIFRDKRDSVAVFHLRNHPGVRRFRRSRFNRFVPRTNIAVFRRGRGQHRRRRCNRHRAFFYVFFFEHRTHFIDKRNFIRFFRRGFDGGVIGCVRRIGCIGRFRRTASRHRKCHCKH